MRVQKLRRLTLREEQGLDETLDGYNDYFRQAIKHGDCELWDINNGDSFCITRMETDTDKGRTILVVCCYKGKDLNEFTNHLTATCDANNWFLRFHTKRRGLVRWMQRGHNFNELEYVAMRGPNNGKQKQQ